MIKENSEPKKIEAGETAGHKAEVVVGDFIEQSFPDFIIVERSKPFDPNDVNHVDLICRIKDGDKFYPLAIDVTFATDKKREIKMKRTAEYPVASLMEEGGRFTGERAPRALLYERSMGLWFLHNDEAHKDNVHLIDVMPNSEKVGQQIRFLESVLAQADNLGATAKKPGDGKEFTERITPIKRIFQEKLKELKKAA